MNCSICGKETINRRITCSSECLAKAHTKGGKVTCGQNRSIGEKHYLYKGKPARKPEDPVKKRCRGKVYDALRRGKLARKPCEVCGEIKSEAHHKDYSKPFEIEWLCRPHHRLADYRDGTKQGDFGH